MDTRSLILPPHGALIRKWKRKLNEARFLAEEAILDAVHYDSFGVGAGALAWGPNCGFIMLSGHNYKTEPGERAPHHFCAERHCHRKAGEHGARVIIGMAVAAPDKPDDETGVDLGVTISCKYCREDFRRSFAEDGLYRPDTRFLYLNTDTRQEVKLTAATVLALCERGVTGR